MKKRYFHLYSYFTIAIMAFVISCSWQDKPETTREPLKSTGKVVIQKEPTNQQIAEYIRHIFQDKNGNFWFGTNGYGTVHYDGVNLSYYSRAEGFGGGQILGITEDNDRNVWFATESGIVKYDWSKTENGAKKFTNFKTIDEFGNWRPWSIFSDSKGVIWVGTNMGVLRFDGTEFKPFEIPFQLGEIEPEFITGKTVWSTYEDSKGYLWFGTNGSGTFKYDRGNAALLGPLAFTRYSTQNGLTDDSVDAIIEDRNGDMWFGTRHGGVSHFDGKKFTNYTDKDSIDNNEVCVIYEDKSGNIWFSSEGYGVYCYNPGLALENGGKHFTNYFKNEGLGVKAVQTIFEDKDGRLWVGGGGGLYRLDEDGSGNRSFVNVKRDGPWQ